MEQFEIPPIPESHDLPSWQRWVAGMLLTGAVWFLGFVIGTARAQATTDEKMVAYDKRIAVVEKNQEKYATHDDVQSIKEDVRYIRDRMDQYYGSPSSRRPSR